MARKLKHSCWIHDSAEDAGADSCDLCYWFRPECDSPMQGTPIGKLQGQGSRLFVGVWRCPDCDTFIDFAKMQPSAARHTKGAQK